MIEVRARSFNVFPLDIIISTNIIITRYNRPKILSRQNKFVRLSPQPSAKTARKSVKLILQLNAYVNGQFNCAKNYISIIFTELIVIV